MTGYTPESALPYPEGGDAVAVHTDVRALALKADALFAPRSWVEAQIAAASPSVTYLGDGVYDIS